MEVKEFITDNLSGSGSGYGDGDGNGNGDGNGYGNGYGHGYGYGHGNGYGYGNGIGCGCGCGYGNGYGHGNGDGNGYGNGDGNGNGAGNGNGYGYGHGIKRFEGFDVYIIDHTATGLESVHGNYAKGFTIRRNSVRVPCYIAKCGDYFAHGKTLHEARQAAQEKYDENRPLEERIADFVAKYPTLDTVVSNRELFNRHHILTGSCLFGRNRFVEERGIDLDGSTTVGGFIDLVRHAYGADEIAQLEKAYELQDSGKVTGEASET